MWEDSPLLASPGPNVGTPRLLQFDDAPWRQGPSGFSPSATFATPRKPRRPPGVEQSPQAVSSPLLAWRRGPPLPCSSGSRTPTQDQGAAQASMSHSEVSLSAQEQEEEIERFLASLEEPWKAPTPQSSCKYASPPASLRHPSPKAATPPTREPLDWSSSKPGSSPGDWSADAQAASQTTARAFSSPPAQANSERLGVQNLEPASSASEGLATLAQCDSCGRRFRTDRLPVHFAICSKRSKSHKRGVFESRSQRWADLSSSWWAHWKGAANPSTQASPAQKAVHSPEPARPQQKRSPSKAGASTTARAVPAPKEAPLPRTLQRQASAPSFAQPTAPSRSPKPQRGTPERRERGDCAHPPKMAWPYNLHGCEAPLGVVATEPPRSNTLETMIQDVAVLSAQVDMLLSRRRQQLEGTPVPGMRRQSGQSTGSCF